MRAGAAGQVQGTVPGMGAREQTSSQGPARLHRAWTGLVRALGGDELAAEGVWSELDGHYTEDHRAYHTWSHIDHVHQVMEWILTRVPADRTAVELAVLFHDAVYDTPGQPGVSPGSDPLGNEAASAGFARTACSLVDLPDELGTVVHDLVLTTRDHRPDTRESAVLCDADLAILASEPATYEVYRRAIRVEYRHVPDDAFRRGRAAILAGLLARDRIYATSLMRDRAEAVARRNLTGELAALQ